MKILLGELIHFLCKIHLPRNILWAKLFRSTCPLITPSSCYPFISIYQADLIINSLGFVYLNGDACANKRMCVAPMSIIRQVGKAAKNIPLAFPGFARGIWDNFRISAGFPGYPSAFLGLPAYVLRKQTGRLTSRKNNKNASPH